MFDRPALCPLPATLYEFAPWKQVQVSLEGHRAFDGNDSSVAYQLTGERVDVRFTATPAR